MKRLVKFEGDQEYGSLYGLFILDSEEWNYLQELIKNRESVYFGESLGKHSEVYVRLTSSNIICVSENQELIELLEKEAGSVDIVGYNPLAYLEDEEDDEDDEDDVEEDDEDDV